MTPHNHLINKQGCPKYASSKGEKLISKIFQNNQIKFETQWHFDKHKDLSSAVGRYLSFDFFLPDHNLCIGYDGEQHFKPVIHWGGESNLIKTQKRDQIKNQFCLDNNISLVRIPYWVKLSEEIILQQLEENSTIRSILK